jgi:hypothetical protein
MGFALNMHYIFCAGAFQAKQARPHGNAQREVTDVHGITSIFDTASRLRGARPMYTQSQFRITAYSIEFDVRQAQGVQG